MGELASCRAVGIEPAGREENGVAHCALQQQLARARSALDASWWQCSIRMASRVTFSGPCLPQWPYSVPCRGKAGERCSVLCVSALPMACEFVMAGSNGRGMAPHHRHALSTHGHEG